MTASPLISKSRLEALTDGVYAVALTLLALDLKLGALPEPAVASLGAALAALLPKALVWALSFWVGALFWLAQNRVLHQYEGLDRPAALIELVQLALITLLPFSTSVIGEHGATGIAALLYSLHLSALAALSLARVQRLRRHPSLRSPTEFDAVANDLQRRRAAALFACALMAAALAWWLPGWNMFALLGILLRRPAERIARG